MFLINQSSAYKILVGSLKAGAPRSDSDINFRAKRIWGPVLRPYRSAEARATAQTDSPLAHHFQIITIISFPYSADYKSFFANIRSDTVRLTRICGISS